MKTIAIRWTINLPMEFPEDWDKEMVEFHLNDSSWCCSNLIKITEMELSIYKYMAKLSLDKS